MWISMNLRAKPGLEKLWARGGMGIWDVDTPQVEDMAQGLLYSPCTRPLVEYLTLQQLLSKKSVCESRSGGRKEIFPS